MIVVVGRPGLDENNELDRPAGLIAVAAAAVGAQVQLVGSIGDDPAGDRVVLALGQAAIGHAALLRDPAAVTSRVNGPSGPLARLDGADVELGLAYLADYEVLVVAEPLPPTATEAARRAAEFQGAALIVVIGPRDKPPPALPASATVLEMPDGDYRAFANVVGAYAARLDNGLDPARAWSEAVAESGWTPSAGEPAEP